jgi:hypothetical protein
VQEAGRAPGPVWTVVENDAPTGIQFPDSPARSGSLYRLSYPGPCIQTGLWLETLKETSRLEHRRGWEDNIKMDLGEIGWKVARLVYLARDRDK